MDFALQLQQSLNQLLQAPQQFNQITKSTIVQLAKIHNIHNRLLPPEAITYIISELHSIKLFQNRKTSLKFAFYYNIIRNIILTNFHQLKNNKIFAVIAMIYAQKLSQFYHEVQKQQKSIVILKHIAQISLINQITLKYLQKSKIFFPEYIKAFKLSFQKLQFAINRNLRHCPKVSPDTTEFTNIQGLLKLSFSKDTEKGQLIFILIGLLNFILKQASSFFTANAYKKDVLKLDAIQQVIVKLQQLVPRLPQQLSSKLQIPPQFKKYQLAQIEQGMINQNQPIYLEQPIQVRELTPRFYNQQQSTKTKFLRKKRNKLEKKMQIQLKQSTNQRLQQRKVVQDVRKQKIQRQVKKQLFVMQKQTEEAKKYHKQIKKVKSIKKESKLGRKGKK